MLLTINIKYQDNINLHCLIVIQHLPNFLIHVHYLKRQVSKNGGINKYIVRESCGELTGQEKTI